MPEFIPGLDLAQQYYLQLVQPLLERHFPGLPHAAALIDYGSEVLGFDTPMSMDHAWSPRLQLFLAEADLRIAPALDELLRRELPTHLLGFPLGILPSEQEPGVFYMDENTRSGDVAHRVSVTCVRDFIRDELDWDVREVLQPADWLTFPAQVLRAVTAGRVFFDNLGELSALRRQLAFYPQDVWVYMLACGWDRIGQEDALMQRAGYVGDELGSAVMASRLVRDIMSLCFLMERQYAPYPKWFGTAFKSLSSTAEFLPALWQAQIAKSWPERAQGLGAACEILARNTNALGLYAPPLPEALSQFHSRPFQVIQAEKYAGALSARITDPEVRRIAQKGLLGSIDQFSDNTIMRSSPRWRKTLRALYD